MAFSIATRSATRISRCITGRKNLSTTAVPRQTIEQIEYEFKKKTTIYLCFHEWTHHMNRVVVRSFKLPHYDSSNGFSEHHLNIDEVKVVASKRPQAAPFFNPWTRFGDNILYHAGGQRISFLDTYKPLLKFENSSRRKTSIKSFPNDKLEIFWGEIDGKLYCIDKNPINCKETRRRSNIFEVLDPKDNTDWRPLVGPPTIDKDPRTLFLKESKKILSWARHGWKTYCFDVEAPETGWKELGYGMRPHGARPFAIHHRNHPELGDFNIYFSYYPLGKDPLLVFPFFMPNDCQSFEAIRNSPIQLPEVCHHYLPGPVDRYQPRILDDYNHDLQRMSEYSFKRFDFVNLGNERFGLLLHKYPYRGPEPGFEKDPELKGGTGGIIFLKFQYYIDKVDNGLKFQWDLLSIRHLRYHPKLRASSVTLAAAFFV